MQKTSLDKKNNGESILESNLSIKIKKIIHPLMLCVSGFKIKYKLMKINKYDYKVFNYKENRPIIYVCNHGTSYDIPIAFKIIKKHTLLLAGKQNLELLDEMFFKLNGTIFVDRKNKEDMKLSKEAMKKNLLCGRNILVFPEGTWNLTDSNLMLEMKWGIIEVCKETNAIIVPIALDYDIDNKICRFIVGNKLDIINLDKKLAIEIVRDSIATLRWKIFESKEVINRDKIDVKKERQKNMDLVLEYPKLDYEYEKSIIYSSHLDSLEVFEPINNLRKQLHL